ncbi:hypothetical protein SAMN05880501_10242 [Ureibacillus xyleni]|uniref:Uncharacterized protein n=1 Tax=Ureibacillus xyleni TaxID=614648 RepID=A0A285RVJ9_9BACL|nr:hypothetical protein [Ureibacillus xyleni]SOB98542.1 hypothetical protein SAMN05880501_10242 [Ureibacillus xyleni]
MRNRKTYEVIFDEREYNCGAIEIIELAKSQRFAIDQISLEDYILEIQQNVWRLYGKGIAVSENASLEFRGFS